MIPIHAFPRVSRSTISVSRLVIRVLFFLYFFLDQPDSLMALSPDLAHGFGFASLLPQFTLALIVENLVVLQIVGAVVFGLLVLTSGRPKQLEWLGLLLFIIYLTGKKSFGGHWDHRELTLLYVAIVASVLDRGRKNSESTQHENKVDFALIVFPILLQYTFVGVARLAFGTPSIFFIEPIRDWSLNRSGRPNQLSLAPEILAGLPEPVWFAINIGFFLFTLLEAAAVLYLFLPKRYLRLVMVLSFFFSHIFIGFFLGLWFPENIALLGLLILGEFSLSRRQNSLGPPGDSISD